MKWIGVLVWSAVALAGPAEYRAQFVGGTVSGISAKSQAHLDFTGSEALLVRSSQIEMRIAYRKINTLEYGQNVSRRYAEAILISPLLLLSKSRKHFVTIGYLDDSDQQQAMVLRVGKGEIRSVLASLEARTGRRIEYQDSEARKAGR